MTVLLDIEDCLINYRPLDSRKSGFTDWTQPSGPHKWLGHYSPEMLNMIQGFFGDNVQWHSDLVRNLNSQKLFPDPVPLGPYQDYSLQLRGVFATQTLPNPTLVIYPDLTPQVVSLSVFENYPMELSKILLTAKWWKLTSIALGLMMNLLPDKVVWAGPELSIYSREIGIVLRHFDAVDRFRLCYTAPCLFKSQITSAYEWLYS